MKIESRSRSDAMSRGGVGTNRDVSIAISGGASSSISEGTSGAVGATSTNTSSGTVSIASGSTREDASGVPSFSSSLEFFQRLRKNYKGVKTEKLRSLQEFERKTERCFDLHPELRSGGRGRGGDAPRGRGRSGRGTGAIEHTAVSATSAIESVMVARIEQLEQRLAAMAGLGASTSMSYEGEDFSYLASAA
ncbi:hypothetical protein AXG93_3337s1150 [Marchantia polymorpha subsp. ruderalis]|uniref:Uncharacterized protein n=1 Tax=Marchantia polymorpha subsp. ruderalis TaxID=1480154 RepID=A0A176W545_MARPO|nr:hypothetical protein AXG93_3337s1150 [Marchantia polymorpha subsp. ruderalis]